MWTLGINCPPTGWHDSAACLVDGDGAVVAFSEEERLSRDRHALHRGPALATALCLRTAGIEPQDVDVVAVGWDVPALCPDAGDASELLRAALGWTHAPGPEVVFVPHHLAHARSAFHASPFPAAGVLVVDGNGEREATSMWRFEAGGAPSLVRSWPIEQSLGYAYMGASRWLGFSMFEAGKTMGLAAFGRAAGIEVPPLVELTDDDYRLALAFEAPPDGGTPFAALGRAERRLGHAWRLRFAELAGARGPATETDRLHTDPNAVRVAYAAQRMVEDAVTWLAGAARAATGLEPLCLAGGVALNCSANGLLPAPVYVPPVAHDAGVALGAAWHVCPPRAAAGAPLAPYLGSPLGALPAPAQLAALGLTHEPFDAARVVELLLDGHVGAVAEGRAEVGPRALCHRSLLALPSPAATRDRTNAIKHREPWRPFGPVSFADAAERFWDPRGLLSAYMLGAGRVTDAGRRLVPAAVHVDGTTRSQTVARDDGSLVGELLRTLELHGAPPVLINTSFNDRGQPIVDNAADAVDAFAALDLSFLLLDDQIVRKAR